MMGDFYEEWVIYQVEAELAAFSYMKAQATPRWRPTPDLQRFIGNCEQARGGREGRHHVHVCH